MVNTIRSAAIAALLLVSGGSVALAEGDLFVREMLLTPQQVALNAPRPADPFALEEAMVSAVMDAGNRKRVEAGLGTLSVDPELSDAARRYSQKMRDLNFFAHDAPDGETLEQRLPEDQRFNYARLGENLWSAQGALDWQAWNLSQQAADDWILSPSHRDNLLEPEYDVAGVGVAVDTDRVFVTMLYGRPQVDPASARLSSLYATPPADLYTVTTDVEREALSSLNIARAEIGLPALAEDFDLSQEARSHAEASLAGGGLSVAGIEGEAVLRRVINQPQNRTSRLSMIVWEASGAVAWQGEALARAALRSWREQGASMDDILTPGYNRTGIGVASDGQKVFVSILLSETSNPVTQVFSSGEPLSVLNGDALNGLSGGSYITIQ